MTLPICILLFVLSAIGIFVALHLSPLTKEQISYLASRRRAKYLQRYFCFLRGRVAVNPQFKSQLERAGSFYPIDVPLESWPRIAAGILKWKKHEWALVAFERNRRVVSLWANKGPNNSMVTVLLPIESLLTKARELGASTILWCHNHPNSDPRHLDLLRPSETDLNTASCLAPPSPISG